MNTTPQIKFNSASAALPLAADSRDRSTSPTNGGHGFNSRTCKAQSHARLTMMPRDEQRQMVAIVCAVIVVCIVANTLPMVLR